MKSAREGVHVNCPSNYPTEAIPNTCHAPSQVRTSAMGKLVFPS